MQNGIIIKKNEISFTRIIVVSLVHCSIIAILGDETDFVCLLQISAAVGVLFYHVQKQTI